jgi:hypothetical protein
MLEEDNTSNPKRFWSFIKNKRADSSGVAPLKRNGVLFSDSNTKANILNDQFTSVFFKETTDDIPFKGDSPYPQYLISTSQLQDYPSYLTTSTQTKQQDLIPSLGNTLETLDKKYCQHLPSHSMPHYTNVGYHHNGVRLQ